MKLSLKKVKFYEEMSEETCCFSASLYVGRKEVARVRNSGQGGSTDVTYLEGWQSKSAQEVEEYAKKNPVVYNFNGQEIKMYGVDHLVDQLFEEWLDKH